MVDQTTAYLPYALGGVNKTQSTGQTTQSRGSGFDSLLADKLMSQSWAQASANSPLLILPGKTSSVVSAVTGPRLVSGPNWSYVNYGLTYDRSTQGSFSSHGNVGNSGYTTPVLPGSPLTPVIPAPPGGFEYSVTQVGEVDRAPMAMFEHNGELVISVISRNDISETPVYTYSDENGLQRRSALPDSVESGHAGYSYGSGLHLTVESWGGMVDYTASSPEGPWTKTDYTYLNPHEYKNLKWGFSYQCPVTGRQFMGFGNSDNPGVVLTYNETSGEWETFAAEDDMRFPTGMGVIVGGQNDGTTLITSNSYGSCRLHAVDASGEAKLLRTFDEWGTMAIDHANQVVYLTQEKSGKVYWSSCDDLENWKECKYQKPAGFVDHIEGMTEALPHPQTGRMIFSSVSGEGNTGFYEAQVSGGEVVLKEVAWLGGVGQWAGKMAVVGDELYFGSGLATGGEADRVPGGIYKIEVTNANAATGSSQTGVAKTV